MRSQALADVQVRAIKGDGSDNDPSSSGIAAIGTSTVLSGIVFYHSLAPAVSFCGLCTIFLLFSHDINIKVLKDNNTVFNQMKITIKHIQSPSKSPLPTMELLIVDTLLCPTLRT